MFRATVVTRSEAAFPELYDGELIRPRNHDLRRGHHLEERALDRVVRGVGADDEAGVGVQQLQRVVEEASLRARLVTCACVRA